MLKIIEREKELAEKPPAARFEKERRSLADEKKRLEMTDTSKPLEVVRAEKASAKEELESVNLRWQAMHMRLPFDVLEDEVAQWLPLKDQLSLSMCCQRLSKRHFIRELRLGLFICRPYDRHYCLSSGKEKEE